MWYKGLSSIGIMRTYCTTNGIITEDKDMSTHLFMDGGKLRLTEDKADMFWKSYKSHIMSGTPVCLVERSNATVCRFFLDIDLKNTTFDVDAFVQKCVETQPDAVYVMCLRRNTGGDILGVHIIFHSLTYTSVEHAKKIAQKFSWVHGIDTSVYSTGLRMIGSVKPQQTPQMDTMYLPVYKVYGSRVQKIPHSISQKSISETSIRMSYTNRHDCCKPMASLSRPSSRVLDIPETSLLHEEYDDCVTSIQEYKDGYYVAKTNARYCMNIKKEHQSAYVYFVIHPRTRTMYQKCFCRCADKTCKTFKSKTVKLSSHTCNLVLHK